MDLKGTVYWEIFTTVWNFFKKYVDVKDTDEYWDNVVSDSGLICEKYSKFPFAKDLTMAALTELERISKNEGHAKLE